MKAAVPVKRVGTVPSCGAVAATAAGGPAAPHSAARSGGGGGGSVTKKQTGTSTIKDFLLGWLPFRAPPKDLVRRGILHAHPAAQMGGRSELSADDVFGNELAVTLRWPDTVNGIPGAVGVLMARLRANDADGIRTEGIFRVPGDATEMRQLRQQVNQGSAIAEVLDQCQNMHSVAGLLKMYFRDLRPPLLTFDLYDDFIQYAAEVGAPSEVGDVSGLRRLLDRLPEGHCTLLQHLIEFLAEVVQYSSENLMKVGNTAAVFAPNLLRPQLETMEHLADTQHTVNLLVILITCREQIFGTAGVALPPSSRTSAQGCSALSAQLSSGPGHGGRESLRSAASSHGQSLSRDGSFASTATPGESTADHLAPSTGGLARGISQGEPRSWYYLTQDHEQKGPVRQPARARTPSPHPSPRAAIHAAA